MKRIKKGRSLVKSFYGRECHIDEKDRGELIPVRDILPHFKGTIDKLLQAFQDEHGSCLGRSPYLGPSSYAGPDLVAYELAKDGQLLELHPRDWRLFASFCARAAHEEMRFDAYQDKCRKKISSNLFVWSGELKRALMLSNYPDAGDEHLYLHSGMMNPAQVTATDNWVKALWKLTLKALSKVIKAVYLDRDDRQARNQL